MSGLGARARAVRVRARARTMINMINMIIMIIVDIMIIMVIIMISVIIIIIILTITRNITIIIATVRRPSSMNQIMMMRGGIWQGSLKADEWKNEIMHLKCKPEARKSEILGRGPRSGACLHGCKAGNIKTEQFSRQPRRQEILGSGVGHCGCESSSP